MARHAFIPTRPWICGFLCFLCVIEVSWKTPAQAPESAAKPAHACSLPGLARGKARGIEDKDLLASYNASASGVQTLEGTVMLRARGGAEYRSRTRESRPLPAMLAFRAPASIRVTGVVPFSGRRSFDLSSDGHELRLLVPDRNLMRFFVGPVDAPATSSNPRENLRPQPIIDALHWALGSMGRSTIASHGGDSETRRIPLLLQPVDHGPPRAAQMEFDLKRGVATELVIQDDSKHAVTEIHYSDWQEVNGNAANSIKACLPMRIVVNQPQQDLEMEMKFIAVDVNLQIPSSKFRLIPPRGIPVTPLGMPDSSHPN